MRGLNGESSMELLQLEHFLAVVDEGSFTRAAERVFRTQPAVSASIKKLEQSVGSPLFARDTPELTLTAGGKELVQYARKMLKLRMTRWPDPKGPEFVFRNSIHCRS